MRVSAPLGGVDRRRPQHQGRQSLSAGSWVLPGVQLREKTGASRIARRRAHKESRARRAHRPAIAMESRAGFHRRQRRRRAFGRRLGRTRASAAPREIGWKLLRETMCVQVGACCGCRGRAACLARTAKHRRLLRLPAAQYGARVRPGQSPAPQVDGGADRAASRRRPRPPAPVGRRAILRSFLTDTRQVKSSAAATCFSVCNAVCPVAPGPMPHPFRFLSK